MTALPDSGVAEAPEPLITSRPDQWWAHGNVLDALARGVTRPLAEAPCVDGQWWRVVEVVS